MNTAEIAGVLKVRRSTVWCLVFVLAGAPGLPSQGAELPPEFQAFLKQHCVRCHGAQGKLQGGLRIDALQGDIRTDGGESSTWVKILDRLSRGEMPPHDEPQPAETVREAAMYWLRTELRKVGHDDSDELSYPDKANYLDHRQLFDPNTKAAPATPARIWRISPFQYNRLMVRLIPPEPRKPIPAPIGLTSDRGFRDYAFRYTVGATETQQMMLNANNLLGRLVRSNPREFPVAALARQEETPTDAQLDEALQWMFEQTLLRQPTTEERQRYGGLLRSAVQRFGTQNGLVRGLAPVFVHPDVLFRAEFGSGDADEFGRVMLTPRELAFAISLALTDDLPDERLLQAAGSGRLQSREDVRREVEQILQDADIEKPRLLRFFREYFGYDQAIDVFKDEYLVHTNFVPFSHLVEDTDQLVLHILDQDRDVLRQLLTTNKSFVNSQHIERYLARLEQLKEKPKPGSSEKDSYSRPSWLGRYYNLMPNQWQPEQPMTLPASQRSGILTQPSWLIAHSNNVENQPIHRGKWIQDHLLGGTIPDTPINVDAKLPDEPHNTLRERMRFTREAYCWACHQRMNPLGLPFEIFSHHGQFRAEEEVVVGEFRDRPVYEGTPVDGSGELRGSGDPATDGPVSDAIDLLHRLADSEHVEQVFVRHAFRYFMGRNETLDDAPTLQEAWHEYRDNHGSMQALVTSLLTSDAFLYRQPLPAAK